MNAEEDSQRGRDDPPKGASVGGPEAYQTVTPHSVASGPQTGLPGYAERTKGAHEYASPSSKDAPKTAPEGPAGKSTRGGNGRHRHAPPGDNPAAAAFKTVPHYLKELASWSAYYLGAKVDGLKLTLRNIAIYAALGVVGLIAAVAIICKAVGLLLSGLSDAIASIFIWLGHPGLTWIGPTLIGLLVLGGLALGIKIGLSKVMGASRKQTELKYEGKRIRQRVDFGQDVSEKAKQSKKRQKQERKGATV